MRGHLFEQQQVVTISSWRRLHISMPGQGTHLELDRDAVWVFSAFPSKSKDWQANQMLEST